MSTSASSLTAKSSNNLIQIRAILLLIFILLPSIGRSLPYFLDHIPNGYAFKNSDSGITCQYLGHSPCAPGGRLNSFGRDFASVGFRWTKSLCNMDSDGDGLSNGQELGDTCCIWTIASNSSIHLRLDELSHPGDAKEDNNAPRSCLESSPKSNMYTSSPTKSNVSPLSVIVSSSTPSTSSTNTMSITNCHSSTSTPILPLLPSITTQTFAEVTDESKEYIADKFFDLTTESFVPSELVTSQPCSNYHIIDSTDPYPSSTMSVVFDDAESTTRP